jgi:hypothetical protein
VSLARSALQENKTNANTKRPTHLRIADIRIPIPLASPERSALTQR